MSNEKLKPISFEDLLSGKVADVILSNRDGSVQLSVDVMTCGNSARTTLFDVGRYPRMSLREWQSLGFEPMQRARKLPTRPGLYVWTLGPWEGSVPIRALYLLDAHENEWSTDKSGTWEECEEEDVPEGLVRLEGRPPSAHIPKLRQVFLARYDAVMQHGERDSARDAGILAVLDEIFGPEHG